ncbi:MAG: hypothetical protein KDI36_06475 [Pseudomonadales bacterium]|nr:hypothetical protein [Pseudomonadales bacterium]
MTGAISQMQMLYIPEEDRILFRVNSVDRQEFRFWITRRYAILMFRVLKEHWDSDPDISVQATPEAKEALRNFKQEQATSGADFSKEFADQPAEMPLGEEAKLAFKLTYNIQGQNMLLGIEPQTGKGISMTINRSINSSLTQLLRAAVSKAEWRLDEQMAGDLVTLAANRVIN